MNKDAAVRHIHAYYVAQKCNQNTITEAVERIGAERTPADWRRRSSQYNPIKHSAITTTDVYILNQKALFKHIFIRTYIHIYIYIRSKIYTNNAFDNIVLYNIFIFILYLYYNYK